MKTYTISDISAHEQYRFVATNPLEALDDVMYIWRESGPVETERIWKHKLTHGQPVRWSYHGLEYMDMVYDPQSSTFIIWDARD